MADLLGDAEAIWPVGPSKSRINVYRYATTVRTTFRACSSIAQQMPSEPPGQIQRDEMILTATSSVGQDISPLWRCAYAAASPAIARAMCVVTRGNWIPREASRPRMPVNSRRVQENHFFKSDQILNILTKAQSLKKHALDVWRCRILPDRNSTWDRRSGPRPADRITL